MNGPFVTGPPRPVLTWQLAAETSRSAVLGSVGTTTRAALRATAPDLVVDPSCADGRFRFATLQGAVDSVLRAPGSAASEGPVVIGIVPGVHTGLVYLPRPVPGAAVVALVGLGATPEDVIIEAAIDAQMPGAEYAARFGAQFEQSPPVIRECFTEIAAQQIIGTFRASVLRIEAPCTQIANLTVRNSYNCDRDPGGQTPRNAAGQCMTGQHQAVAALVSAADGVLFDRVHLESFQDTLYLEQRDLTRPCRTWLRGCVISGDVDFIFGQATGYFEDCRIVSRGQRANSWATAPATNIRTPYGFVFERCRFTHDGSERALAGRMRLGRQWFEAVRATPYGQPTLPGYRVSLGPESRFHDPGGTISRASLEAVGKCLILNSEIDDHIRPDPWGGWAEGDADQGGWSLRYRPAQYSAADFFHALGPWLARQGLDYSDIDPATPWLGEFPAP